jgi:3-methyladenine DNA glycosylase Tag
MDLTSTSPLSKSLEDLGELRPEWLDNPRYVRGTIRICAPLIGALGVLTGYTFYFRLEPILHHDESALSVFWELLVAASMVAILEWVKEVIKGGAKHLVPSRSTVVISIFTVLLFEVFVLAAHALADAEPAEMRRAIGGIWQGSWFDLFMIAFIWVIIGAVLTAVISSTIFQRGLAPWRHSRVGAVYGIAAGLIAAAIVLAYVFVARAIVVVKYIAFDHSTKWHDIVSKSDKVQLFGHGFNIGIVGQGLDWILDTRPIGPVPLGLIVLVLLLGGLAYWCRKADNWAVFGWIAFLGTAVLVVPVRDVNCIWLPLYVIFAWGMPGAVLGATVPWLRLDWKLPRSCAPALFVIAAAFLGTSLSTGPRQLLLIPSIIFALMGFEIILGRTIKDYWPVLALSIVSIVCIMSIGTMQHTNFEYVLERVSGLTSAAPLSGTLLGSEMRQEQASKDPKNSHGEADVLLLQNCLIGSLSFWVTVGLLMGWSIRDTQRRTSVGGDGKIRCFWAHQRRMGALEYHDASHGIMPANDAQLLMRLAFELTSTWYFGPRYINYSYMDLLVELAPLLDGFAPEKLATQTAKTLEKRLASKRRRHWEYLWFTSFALERVIDNAKCFVALSRKNGNKTVLQVLQEHSEHEAGEVVTFFRENFKVTKEFAVGSFLQATGFLPGAHFSDCFRDRGHRATK